MVTKHLSEPICTMKITKVVRITQINEFIFVKSFSCAYLITISSYNIIPQFEIFLIVRQTYNIFDILLETLKIVCVKLVKLKNIFSIALFSVVFWNFGQELSYISDA
jgi:hypothetical protein